MRHPIEKYNQIQAERLADFPPEERAFQARQFRISNAAYAYQHQFNEVAGLGKDISTELPGVGPHGGLIEWLEKRVSSRQENRSATELIQLYFEEYLEGLPSDRVRAGERERGLEEAKRSWPFRRYVLERNDFGMNEFMRLNLSDEDYTYYKQSSSEL